MIQGLRDVCLISYRHYVTLNEICIYNKLLIAHKMVYVIKVYLINVLQRKLHIF